MSNGSDRFATLLTDHPPKRSSHQQCELNPRLLGVWVNSLPTESIYLGWIKLYCDTLKQYCFFKITKFFNLIFKIIIFSNYIPNCACFKQKKLHQRVCTISIGAYVMAFWRGVRPIGAYILLYLNLPIPLVFMCICYMHASIGLGSMCSHFYFIF